MKRSPLAPGLLALSLFAGACAHQGAMTPRPTATPPSAAPRMGDSVRWVRTAAEYRALTISTYRAASEAVTHAARGRTSDTWAVVLDADETVLDNSVFQRDLSLHGAPFSEERWATWVRQRSAPPIPGAKAFLSLVKELGGRIAIVTNRFASLCEDTKENFRIESMPFDVMLCRVDIGDKNPRFASVAGGAAFPDGKPREVVAFVGDNILDFPALKQSLRDAPESAFDAFGKRFFVLPNPMYGSWQQMPVR